MKFMHLSDLHIGKRLNEVNLIEDQAYILDQIVTLAKDIRPAGILLAGDIYDKSMPSSEAVSLFDQFLSNIAQLGMPCFVISGNHDSPERIAFGSSIMEGQKIYMSKVFGGHIEPVTLSDAFGEVAVYMLPFIKPAHVKTYYKDVVIETYEDALSQVICSLNLDATKRNVLVMHQFITAMGTAVERCDSESISVGGSDNIDVSVFDAFDYVALGHLHKPHKIGRETVRYSGSPLKYSFSETQHQKSVCIVSLEEKGSVKIEALPLVPKRDLRKLKGPIGDLLSKESYEGTNLEDYIHVTLTDEEEILDAIGRMRQVYPNIMSIEFENSRSRKISNRTGADSLHDKSDLELFSEFYELQNNEILGEEKLAIVKTLLEKLGEELL
jgi:exonuclease SbcD